MLSQLVQREVIKNELPLLYVMSNTLLFALLLFIQSSSLFADDIDIYYGNRHVKSNENQAILVVDLADKTGMAVVDQAIRSVLKRLSKSESSGASSSMAIGLIFAFQGRYAWTVSIGELAEIRPKIEGVLKEWREFIENEPNIENISLTFSELKTSNNLNSLLSFDGSMVRKSSSCSSRHLIVISGHPEEALPAITDSSVSRKVSDVTLGTVHRIKVEPLGELSQTNGGELKENDRSAARKNNGAYQTTVRGANELEEALYPLLMPITKGGTTLFSPSLAGQQVLNSKEGEKLYAVLFSPTEQLFWPGNIKQYRLDEESGDIVGADDKPVIVDGRYDPSAKDLWAKSSHYLLSDQGGALEGGFTSRIAVDRDQQCGLFDRRLYTFMGDYLPEETRGWVSVPEYVRESDLSRAEHCLKSDEYTLARMITMIEGQRASAQRTINETVSMSMLRRAVDWVNGIDYRDTVGGEFELVQRIGSVIHSKPTLVDYGGKQTLFVSTNQGYLHAIDAESGEELFAFLPQELLYRLPTLYANPLVSPDHPEFYGLDSRWTVWRNDAVKKEQSGIVSDGVIDRQKNSKDHVFIYGGMRRGGYNYYALDVTDATLSKKNTVRPRLKFVVKGGQAADEKSPFRRMGQTWSEPVLARVKFEQRVRDVIFFGGGFDAETYEGRYQEKRANEGNQIYMLDANSGELLWWASDLKSRADLKSQYLTHSITARIKALDLDGDGLKDRLYVVDLGGQVLRLSIDGHMDADSNTGWRSPFAKIERVALFGGTEKADRRFYHAPSVTVLPNDRGDPSILVAVASGDRSEPKSSYVDENLFVFFDDEEVGDMALGNSGEVLFSDLDSYDIDIRSKEGVKRERQRRGWRMSLGRSPDSEGEKMMGSPLFYKGLLLFTTYVPPQPGRAVQGCMHDIGFSRLYIVDGTNGAATAIFKNKPTDIVGASGRFLDAVSPGIAGEIQLLFGDDAVRLLVGPAVLEMGQEKALDLGMAVKTLSKRGWLRIR